MILSRQALEEAEQYYLRTGDELQGFLSEESGFLPRRAAEPSLPGSHRAWDEIAAALPSLWRDLQVRQAVHDLPALRATTAELPARYVRRASTILGMLAHSYVYSELDRPDGLPSILEQAWDDIGQRLGKPEPFLRYEDIVLGNWRQPDPSSPLTLEHLELLVPILGIDTERRFYLSQVEIHARATPLVGSVVRVQEAITRGENESAEAELLTMIEIVRAALDEVLIKVDPNVHSPTSVDPVLWGVLVAPFVLSFKAHVPGPGGTAAPFFHVLDAFLGRRSFDSTLGEEVTRLRSSGPKAVDRFVHAVEQGPGAHAIRAGGSRRLCGLVQTLADVYAGPRGLLEAHRLKAYGFLETAFKVGRPVTIGGFKGTFHDRGWRKVHEALNEARAERDLGKPFHSFHAVLTGRTATATGSGVKHVFLNVRDEGVVHRPGDRCRVLPTNTGDQVHRTLRALKAKGDEPAALTPSWRVALRDRPAGDNRDELPLAELLAYAKLRPLPRAVAKALVSVSGSCHLQEIVEARREDERELWEALELIAADGFDVTLLWTRPESLATVVPPETFRPYSIASASRESAPADEIELAVETVEYTAESGSLARRQGTASSYINEIASTGTAIPIQIVRPSRFRLPADARVPILMFAERTAVASFRPFLYARADAPDAGDAWLFLEASTRDEISFRDELLDDSAPGWWTTRLALSDEGPSLEEIIHRSKHAELLRNLIRSPDHDGRGAHIYIAGRDGFVLRITDALRGLTSAPIVRRLAAERRLMFQAWPTHAPWRAPGALGDGVYDISELALHNDDDHGYWFMIDGNAYDMTEFRHLHPGGSHIVDSSAGLDASSEYATVLHYRDPEINAMLAMYKIGAIRRLRFGGVNGVALHDLFRTWVRFLYLIVEMQNALRNDLSYLSAQTTAAEPCAALTPLKLMLFSNTHDRFIELYYKGLLGEPLHELWRHSAALCDPTNEGGWPERELTALASAYDEELASVRSGLGDLWEDLRGGSRDRQTWSRAREVVGATATCDRDFLSGMKGIIRQGIQVFERHEQKTLEHGGAVLGSLRRVPYVVESYHRDVARVPLPGPRRGSAGRSIS